MACRDTSMKSGGIVFVTFSLLATTALTATISENSITVMTVQPGPVKVIEGNNVSLWCQFRNGSQNRILVLWQSPPKFRTRTSNCLTFGAPFKRKYVMSCAGSHNTRWYNMTITDVRWVDRGKYRCIHYRYMGIVDVQVLVPVNNVSLTYVSNGTSYPLILRRDVDAVLTCTTNCAYPAPTISWFENGQPLKGNATVSNTESGCTGDREGQTRTVSTVTVTGKYVDKARKESTFFCIAENVIGEPKISRMIDIIYDGESKISIYDDATMDQRVQAELLMTHAEIIGIITVGLGVVIIILACFECFSKNRRSTSRNGEEGVPKAYSTSRYLSSKRSLAIKASFHMSL